MSEGSAWIVIKHSTIFLILFDIFIVFIAVTLISGKRVVVATPRIIKPNEERLYTFYLRLQVIHCHTVNAMDCNYFTKHNTTTSFSLQYYLSLRSYETELI